MSGVPQYIAERIRRPAPADAPVVPGSTPVVAFGDPRTAWAATLGLNPSKVEFLDRDGRLLADSNRRLETHASLGIGNLASASDAAVAQVLAGCNGYFQRRPYNWFNKLERVLRHAGASYFDGTACHLDLVQWATEPVWGKLDRPTREKLLDADLPFLRQQLAQEHIRLLLLNGMQIVRACARRLSVPLEELVEHRRGRVRFFAGRAGRDSPVWVGTSTFSLRSASAARKWTASARRCPRSSRPVIPRKKPHEPQRSHQRHRH